MTEKQFGKQKYPFGFAVIDVFSKYAAVCPLKGKGHEGMMQALLQSFKEIGKQPEIVYTDPDSAFFKKDVESVFEEAGIQYIRTQAKPYFAERFI